MTTHELNADVPTGGATEPHTASAREHNRRLRQRVEAAWAALAKVQQKADLPQVVDMVTATGDGVAFRFGGALWLGLLLLAIPLWMWGSMMFDFHGVGYPALLKFSHAFDLAPHHRPSPNGQFLMQIATYLVAPLIPLTAGVALLLRIQRDRSSLNDLQDFIGRRAVCLDNGIFSANVHDFCNTHMRGHFHEFGRGNYSNTISHCNFIHIHYKGREYKLHGYHYHYVDEREETYTETDSDGHTTYHTRTVYDHYNRYGIITPAPVSAPGVRIGTTNPGFNGVRWISESSDFNHVYYAYADTQHAAARFLRPRMILALLDASRYHSWLNLEFSHDGLLCMSFANDGLTWVPRRYGLKQPQHFKRELMQHRTPQRLLNVLHTLHELHENH